MKPICGISKPLNILKVTLNVFMSFVDAWNNDKSQSIRSAYQSLKIKKQPTGCF